MKAHVEGFTGLLLSLAFCMDMTKVAETDEEKAKWEGRWTR